MRRCAIYRQFLMVAFSPLSVSNPPDRLGKVLFLAVSPGGLFSGCVAWFQSLAASSGVILVVACGPGYPAWLCDQGIVQGENSLNVECNRGPAGFYNARS